MIQLVEIILLMRNINDFPRSKAAESTPPSTRTSFTFVERHGWASHNVYNLCSTTKHDDDASADTSKEAWLGFTCAFYVAGLYKSCAALRCWSARSSTQALCLYLGNDLSLHVHIGFSTLLCRIVYSTVFQPSTVLQHSTLAQYFSTML